MHDIAVPTAGTGGDGVRAEIRIGRHIVLVDEPPALGGADDAPHPVENALAGLLSCQVVTYRFWAVKLGIPLQDVAVYVERYQELAAAVDAHRPVLDLFRNTTPVTTELVTA